MVFLAKYDLTYGDCSQAIYPPMLSDEPSHWRGSVQSTKTLCNSTSQTRCGIHKRRVSLSLSLSLSLMHTHTHIYICIYIHFVCMCHRHCRDHSPPVVSRLSRPSSHREGIQISWCTRSRSTSSEPTAPCQSFTTRRRTPCLSASFSSGPFGIHRRGMCSSWTNFALD